MAVLSSSVFFNIVALFLLISKIIAGESILNASDIFIYPTNFTLNSILSLEIKHECQSIADCSEGSLECKSDNSNGTNSYCVYPNYVCSDYDTCYIFQITNKNQGIYLSTKNNSTEITLEQVIGNESESIKKIINTTDNHNNTLWDANKINDSSNDLVCSNEGDCPLNYTCNSGQCQLNINTPQFFCSTEINRYKCREIIDETCGHDTNKNCSSSSPSVTSELKYVLISMVTLSAIVVLGVALYLINSKSKSLQNSDLENYVVSIV